MRRRVLGVLLAVGNLPGAAWADPLIGLLGLPTDAEAGPCLSLQADEIPLYAQPQAGPAIGALRPDASAAGDGCRDPRVAVLVDGGRIDGELPLREIGYEAPAAIVLEARPPWYRIRLADGSAWVRVDDAERFASLHRLLVDGLAYVAIAPDAPLRSTADVERPDPASVAWLQFDDPVRVLDSREIDGRLWLKVERLIDSFCETGEEPDAVATGWLPAHDASGEPLIWFYSRGC